MGGLFGGGGAAFESPKLAGIQIQTSCYGGAIPLVWGTTRIAGNLVWYSDFAAIPHEETQSGGKGGGSMAQTTYTYQAAVILALCEGPVAGVNRVWQEKTVKALAAFGLALYKGDRPQAVWPWLSTSHAAQALPYSGTCYAASAALDLGTSGAVGNYNFEVQGACVIPTGQPGAGDAHPADVVVDMLTNAYYGAGWAGSRIADLTQFRTYCTAAGFFLSPALTDQKGADQHLQDLLAATNSEAVWSQGVLKIVPYGDVAITGNGASYAPNVTPIYDLGPDDFVVERGQDPITIERAAKDDTFNVVPVEFCDRALDYNTNVVEGPEQADIDTYGLRKDSARTLHAITSATVATQISRILAQRSTHVRSTYTFSLGWRHCLLEPMDLVTLTEPMLGLDHVPVRIVEIEEDPDGKLTAKAKDWPFGVAAAALYSPQPNDGHVPDVGADPGDAYAPAIRELPPLLTGGVPTLALATAGGPLWGGCEVWISADGSTYAYAGTVDAPCRYGTLSAALPAATGLDATNALAVALADAALSLQGTTAQGRDDLLTAVLVDGEVLGYQSATLTGSGAYSLSSLRRGAYGTAGSAHASGASWIRLDGSELRYAIPASRLGATVYVKLLSYNPWGGGKQSLADVAAYTHVIQSAATTYPAPASVTLTLTGSRPTPQTGDARAKLDELSLGAALGDSDAPAIRRRTFGRVAWDAVSITPPGLLTGYEIALYEGTDPSDASAYLTSPLTVAASATATVVVLDAPDSAVTVHAAVRAIFGTAVGPWTTSGSTGSLAASTVSVAPRNLTGCPVGNVTLDDVLSRALTGLGSTTDVAWYRGNVDAATRGGAPNISCAALNRTQWNTSLHIATLDLTLAPTAASDNLDALRYAKVEWYQQSAAGTSGTLTAIGTQYVPLPDRLYKVPGTHSDAGNVVVVSIQYVNANISGGVPACKLTLYNVNGPSDTHCYYTPASGTQLVDSGTSWPSGLTGGTGGGTGGGGGYGGNCPAPWTPILMADGREVRADELRVGDLVRTRHETTGEWGAFRVAAVERAESERTWVVLRDRRALLFSPRHRVLTDGGEWVEVERLAPGTRLAGPADAVVTATLRGLRGAVVRIAVDDAHTYVAGGVLSHNIKTPTTVLG